MTLHALGSAVSLEHFRCLLCLPTFSLRSSWMVPSIVRPQAHCKCSSSDSTVAWQRNSNCCNQFLAMQVRVTAERPSGRLTTVIHCLQVSSVHVCNRGMSGGGEALPDPWRWRAGRFGF